MLKHKSQCMFKKTALQILKQTLQNFTILKNVSWVIWQRTVIHGQPICMVNYCDNQLCRKTYFVKSNTIVSSWRIDPAKYITMYLILRKHFVNIFYKLWRDSSRFLENPEKCFLVTGSNLWTIRLSSELFVYKITILKQNQNDYSMRKT